VKQRRRAGLLAMGLAAAGCGASRAPVAHTVGPRPVAAVAAPDAGRPKLTSVVRDGDGAGALAIAVSTEGIADDRGALVAVALAALVEERLANRGIEASAVGGWNGWRLRALVASPGDAARILFAAREALLQPVAGDEPALAAVARKAAALARHPLPDTSLRGIARCTGEAYASGDASPPSPTELETWRVAAHGLGRIAVAVAGDAGLAGAVADALAHTAPWPRPSPTPPALWPDDSTVIYEASGEVAPGAARIVVTARALTAARAVAVAPALGDTRGALALRLAGLDAPARVRSVIATAHVDGGCVALTLDLAAPDLASSAPERIATAAALARQEMSVEIADGAARPDGADESARRAADPRDAAERAAWWALASSRGPSSDPEPRLALAVGVATARSGVEAPKADALRAAIDRAALAWRSPIVEGRARVERGQGETWLLLASPCGTRPEAFGDAGLGATVAAAAAAQAESEAGDARVEPFIDAEGIGVVIHGPARPAETPVAHARRIADLAARALAAIPLDPARVDAARTLLLAGSTEAESRLFAVLAGAVAPEHPSWLTPSGTVFGLMSATADAVATRAGAVRAGPLRVAVLADADATQAAAAVSAVDRWVARRPGDAGSCPSVPTLSSPRAGTYAVDLPIGAPSEALIAAALPPDDAAARRAALAVAAALDGPDGLLARALAAEDDAGAPRLARAWSANVVGAGPAAALVVRLVGADGSLDSAVAQTRALLDRVRQGALRDEDRARADAVLARARAAGALDPRARLVDLWRGEPPYVLPSLDELRSFAAARLRDDGLIIVAARPGRVAGARR